MRIIGNYLVVEHAGEIERGDLIRDAQVEQTPETAPAVYRKQLYYGSKYWLPEDTDQFLQTKKELSDQLKQMEEISQYLTTK